MIMDFTTTAMARPELLEQTYASFSKNLRGIDLQECTLYLNIDPQPAHVCRLSMLEVARKYFGDVHVRMPKEANFTAALNWLWSKANTRCIFHLEDDWELRNKIDVKYLYDTYFKPSRTLYEVALRAYSYEYSTCPLSPCILHERYYKKVAGNLDTTMNPEVQLRGEKWGLQMPGKEPVKISPKGRVVCFPEERKKIVVYDMGREWMKKQPYKRPDKKYDFTKWVEE